MPAARTCRACGAPLPGDLRWCTRCYAPVHVFTPRAPLHATGSIVGTPIHTGGHAPHWSRWERSATTFGPAGRIVATVLLFLSVPLSWSFGVVMYLLVFPLVAIPVLGSIWARGWVVPGEPELPPIEDPVREEPVPTVPLTPAQIVWRATWWAGTRRSPTARST